MVKFEIALSADQKQIEKKNWCNWDKGIYLTDETTMIYVYDGNMSWVNIQVHLKTFLRMN